jgi:hypothetical protein
MKMKFLTLLMFAACFSFKNAGAQSIAAVGLTSDVSKEVTAEGITVTPASGTGNFLVQFTASTAGKAGITVTDRKGNGMLTVDVIAAAGKNAIPINLTSYAPGTYKITVSGAGAYGTASVVVTR